jgi:hypothetical protein
MTADRRGLARWLSAHPGAIAVLVAGIIVFLAVLLRQEGVPKADTIWAEDGQVFLGCAYQPDSLGCLLRPYQGYVHLVPRLIAFVAVLGPPTSVSVLTTILAALVAALCAAIAASSIVDATGSAVAGLLGGSGLGLVWQAGREVLGNAANIHWVLLAAALVAMACVALGAPIRRSTIALAVAAAATSAFAPLVAIGAGIGVLLRRPGAARLLIPTAVAAGLELLVVLTSARVVPSVPSPGFAQIAAFLRTEVIRNGFFGPLPLVVGALVLVALILVMGALALAAGRRRVTMVTAATVAAMIGTGFAVCLVSVILNRALNPRYAYLPDTLIVAGLAIAAGVLARELGAAAGSGRRLAPAVVPVVALVVGIGFAASFRLQARASTGPSVPQEIAGAAASCSPTGSASISIAPRPASDDWVLVIPCARLTAR